MTRPPRTSGPSRTLLRTATATAALSALSVLACGIASTAGADDSVQTVNPSGLGPTGPWLRLQETAPDRDPGIQEVSPKPDPVQLNGSLHLAIGAGEQAQAAHYFNATWTPEPMQPILDAGISYWAYTSTEGSSATNIGANLQLPASCGGFTTLSFEPGSNTDEQGDALKPDTWQRYVFTADSVMRTSNAVAGIPAGGSAPLSHFIEKCEGAYGVIANIGRLGDADATLNTYVDNITAKGTIWDFAVTGRASAALTVPETIQAGDDPRPADASYTDPADGPEYPGIGTHLTFDGPNGLRADQLTVMSADSEVPLTEQPDGTLTGELRTDLRAGGTLEPGGEAGAAFTLAAGEEAPTGRLKVTAELTVTIAGVDGPQRTGVSATDHTWITAAGKPHPQPTYTHHPKPTPTYTHHPKPTPTWTHHPKPTPTPTPTYTHHPKPTPTWTHHPKPTPTPTPTYTHHPKPTPTWTHHPKPTPTYTHHPKPTPTYTHHPKPTPTPTPTYTHHPKPTHPPKPAPTHTHHPKPTPTPTPPGDGNNNGNWGGGSGGSGSGPIPNGPVDAGDGSTALTGGSASSGMTGTGLAVGAAGAAGLLAVAGAALGGLRTVRRRRG
ncbi:hypothetical protein OG782_22220 [Streptomyces sp. NBC_00876]|uniref:hypothetical protein n=1 Tax=Streptomyces sp. NBC_00876 TaxID=2975853 RepID=UPI0038705BF8|nr:hypothetical protein OG782_22220 [Streptomyces sp. NBC_00876]